MGGRQIAGLDLAATEAFARGLARTLKARLLLEGRAWLGLVGDLGAGKTTFVRALVGEIEPTMADAVSSPTYAIAQTYPCRPPVHHLDVYRLQGPAELHAIGYPELFEAPGLTVVEWADRLNTLVPDEHLTIGIEGDDLRDLRLAWSGPFWDEVISENT